MALSNIVAQRQAFQYHGEEFSVRGLTFDDITKTLLDHEAEVEDAFEVFEKTRSDDGEIDPAAALPKIVNTLPALTAGLMARAADEPEAAGNFLSLPVTIQLDVILDVRNLTFTEPDSLKKFAAHLASLLSTMKLST